MKNADIPGHRSRSSGVYYVIANNLSERLAKHQVSYTDVVTLIDMRDTAVVDSDMFMQPISWELYNKLVGLCDNPFRGSSHGNYLPALDLAKDVVDMSPANCAIMIFFLSDGRPSDFYGGGKSAGSRFAADMNRTVKHICTNHATRLSFCAIGCSGDEGGNTFTFLERMVEIADKCGVNKAFFKSGLDTMTLKDSLTTLTSSLTSTALGMSTLCVGPRASSSFKVRLPGLEREGPVRRLSSSDVQISSKDWYLYWVGIDGLSRHNYSKSEVQDSGRSGLRSGPNLPMQHARACGIAVKKKHFGEGAERIVREMFEIDEYGTPCGAQLVAKFNPNMDVKGKQLAFHNTFARTQTTAADVAKKFNSELDRLRIDKKIPRVEYIPCTFYKLTAEDWTLSEPKLDPICFHKYNDNKGGVHNLPRKTVLGGAGTMFEIAEEDEDDEDEDEDDDDEDSDEEEVVRELSAKERRRLQDSVLDDDVPQAFSHWSYVSSNRAMLICDIQGVLTSTQVGQSSPTKIFRLTDPAIHRRRKNRFQLRSGSAYGKTNLGNKGIRKFLDTHECNNLCRLLGI
eukprot:GHVU01015732.1.p1 GENE.GHVU01015732.1~~GHVU01015732.1.p1  ORF type:complete len:568 (-),score=66.72 GHVU01015732.1:653-2356(-)